MSSNYTPPLNISASSMGFKRPERDPEIEPWILALAMTFIVKRLQILVGQPIHIGTIDWPRTLAEQERRALMSHNEIFRDLPELGFANEGQHDIRVYWQESVSAPLPLPSHPLLWEFLGTRPANGSPKVSHWHRTAPHALIAVIHEMEADPEGRALLVDFDNWREHRKGTAP